MFGRLTPMVKNLLLVTVAAYLIPQLLGWRNINAYLGLWPLGSDFFKPYQVLTYMFAHGSFMHILFNMLGLIFLAPMLEQFWGSKRFLTFYLVTGIGAGLFYQGIKYAQTVPMKTSMENYIENPNPEDFSVFMSKYAPEYYNQVYDFIEYYDEHEPEGNTQSINYVKQAYEARVDVPMVGASGAIYGILMAFGMLFPNTTLMLLFPPIPIKAKYLVLILGGMELYSEFTNHATDNVAHLAHLGGMIFAFLMIKIWTKQRNRFY